MRDLVILCLCNGGQMPRNIARLIRYRASMYRAMGYEYGFKKNYLQPDRLPLPAGGHPTF